ncbi:MAG: acyl-CoA dehydrogenase family protein [Ignavibacteriales bacterium]|nr:acyl-CoA dehydrogenase family protein [Ignavibacteriales bacterium]MCB9209786.1 acyl-CoA dehydrogenase family protein [Ignavibacteriales bacterium]MCB9218942.1 acyl-CoA dehydrogenase family protein [Ignavibacteriales bacterium]
MQKFSEIDYYELSDLLTDEEKLVRESVRDFVENDVLPIIEESYQSNKFPIDLVPKLGELGVFGITLPEKYGCPNLNNICYGLAMQELERGDSGLRSFASVQSSLVMYPIFTFGNEDQKLRWLPKLATGEKIGCFGLTETDYGSNPGGMVTNAKKVDGGYVLNGAKMWITNGTIADLAIVWAKLEGKVKGFLVEKGIKGFSAPEMKGKHSLRSSITSELIFQDVFVPDENLLPLSDGLKAPLMCLNQARFGIAWGVVGSMMAVYESALEYSKSRIQFSKAIAGYQLTQQKLVNILTEITKAQLLNYRLAVLKDQEKVKHTQISMAKRNNCEVALNAARTAREILGANGILSEYPVMRHSANLESVKTYEGTHEMHTLIIGENITGFSAFE